MLYRSLVQKLKLLLARKARYQSLFQKIHELGLYGMNYSNTGTVQESGEWYVQKYIKRKHPYIKNIFDVGANRGDFSLLAAETFGHAVMIDAFEPGPSTFQHLQSRIQLSNVRLHNFGMREVEAQMLLYSDRSASPLASVYADALASVKDLVEHKVPIKTIDDFCQLNGIGEIDFLKIDTEGHELAVLKGAGNMLQAKKSGLYSLNLANTTCTPKCSLRTFLTFYPVPTTCIGSLLTGWCL